jgi:hypothetical protein
MEKFGLGPEELLQQNPGLIYARLTGYGESGPLSHFAGKKNTKKAKNKIYCGASTLSITTFSIKTLTIMIFSIKPLQ